MKKGKHLRDEQNEGGVSRRIRLSAEKAVSSGFWIRKHAVLAPATQSLLGFRLRSPLLRRGTLIAQPSNGFFIHKP